LKTAQIYNLELQYDFADYVIIDLTFRSDTVLYWKERSSGADATEDIHTIHMDDHTTLTGWVEHDKTIVSLYSDFAKGETYGFQHFSDGRIRKLIGTIKPKA
jgi:hypothetical protein